MFSVHENASVCVRVQSITSFLLIFFFFFFLTVAYTKVSIPALESFFFKPHCSSVSITLFFTSSVIYVG